MMDNGDYVEKELKREWKFLRNIMATIPDSLLILDRELRIKSANHSFYKLFETEPENVLDMKIADILGDEDGNLGARLAGLFGTEAMLESLELHYQSEKLGERILNITARGIIVEEEEEEQQQQLVMVQDITERKRAEAQVKELEGYLQLQVDRMPIGLITLDRDLHVQSWNPAAKRIFGFTAREAMGKHAYDLIVPKHIQPQVDAIWRRLLEDDNTSQHTHENITKDGRLIVCQWSNARLRQANGAVIGVLSMVQDITEHKQAEDSLKESNRRLQAHYLVSQLLSESLNLNTVSTLALKATLQTLGLDAGFIRYVNEARQETVLLGSWGIPSEISEEVGRSLGRRELTGGLVGEVVQTGLPLVVEDFAGRVRHSFLARAGFQSAIVMPLQVKGKVVGTMTGLSAQQCSFSAANTEMMASIGATVGMAIANARLFEEVKDRAEKLSAMNSIAAAIASILDMDTIYVTLAGELQRIISYDRLAVGLLTPEGDAISIRQLGQVEQAPWHQRLEDTSLGEVVKTGEPRIYRDMALEASGYPVTKRIVEMGFHSSLVVPLSAKGKLLGTLNISSREVGHYSLADLEYIQPIADQLAVALIHAQLFAQVEAKGREWQRTFDAMSEGVAIIDNDYRIQRANQSLARMLGTSPQNLIGRNCYKMVHDMPGPIDGCPGQRCKEGRKACSFELCESHLGNRWMELHADPLMDATGEVVGVIHIFRDVTDEKQRQEASMQQKELTDRILATTPNAVLVIDKELAIQLVNQAFCKMFNRRQEDVVGRPLRDVLPVEELSRSFLQVMANGAPRIDLEFRYKLGGGESIFLSHAVPMLPKGEKEQQYLIILRDITLERAAQAQFYHVQSLATIGELAAGVAHEINNPLTTVLGYSELALTADIPSEMKADMEAIRRNAQRAAAIVKNLLAFARKQEPQKKLLSLNDLIKQVLEIRGYQLKVSNIEVVSEFASGLPEIMADHQQLEQVILNIISNAEYAMLEAHERGTLAIKTELVGNTVRILLTDDGPGISRKNIYRIFDPFFTTKGPGKGTGLGLSICHGIVTEHGGRIYAESEEGKGATFFIELPVANEGDRQ